jgi:hypothetical protein
MKRLYDCLFYFNASCTLVVIGAARVFELPALGAAAAPFVMATCAFWIASRVQR